MKKPLEPRRIAGWFAIAVVILGWISLASYWSTNHLIESFDAVTKTHQVLDQLEHIQAMMESAESSVHSFVITGKTARLEPYRYATLVVPYELKQLEGPISVYPQQQASWNKLTRLLAAHLSYLAKTVNLRRSEGYDAAVQWILTQDGSSKREAMERLLSEIQQKERAQLDKLRLYTSEHSLKTKVVLLLATFASLILLGWVFGLLRIETDERRHAESATHRTESFLHSIVDNIPYMILVKEAEHLRLTLVNKAAEQWLGRSRRDLLGSNELDRREQIGRAHV